MARGNIGPLEMVSTVQIYNKIADKYAKAFKCSPEERSIIIDFINRLGKKAKVLDVGCGNSDYYDLFNNSGIRYTGIDISPNMIRIAQEKHPNGIFKVQDMNSMNLEQDSFDGIFCFFSLIHIPDKNAVAFLEKIYRLRVD